MNRVSPTLLVAGSLLAAGTALLFAAGPGSPDALIPYQGRLDFNGAGLNGPVDLRVGLFTSGVAGTSACLGGASVTGCGLWADEFSDVPVSGGAFAVSLGSGDPLPNTVFTANDNLWIGFAVRVGTDNYAVLGGMHQLHATPYAVRADNARNLTITQNLNVGGSATVGTLQVSGGSQLSTLNVAGSTALGAVTMGDVTAGTVSVFELNGTVVSRALSQTDVSPPTIGGPPFVPYLVSRTRYLAEATKGVTTLGVASRVVRLDEARMDQMCSDEDGCTVTLSMANWSNNNNATFVGPYRFYWGDLNGNGDREWRISGNAAADDGNVATAATVAGVDGDGVTTHVLRDHNCFFTDASYTEGSAATTDNGVSLFLLNYNVDNYPTATCRLIVED